MSATAAADQSLELLKIVKMDDPQQSRGEKVTILFGTLVSATSSSEFSSLPEAYATPCI